MKATVDSIKEFTKTTSGLKTLAFLAFVILSIFVVNFLIRSHNLKVLNVMTQCVNAKLSGVDKEKCVSIAKEQYIFEYPN